MTVDTGTPAAPVDLTDCDREPIRIPGSVQPHGVLIAFVEPGLEIVSVSDSALERLGRAPEALLGRTLSTVLAEADAARVLATPSGTQAGGLAAVPVRIDGTDWMALVHRHDGLGILELEPVNPRDEAGSTLLTVAAAARRLQGSTETADACRIAVEEVRRLTGFDRVKLYRFAADWSGEVLAETRDEAMPSYLGLHFPATDIPVQARALYVANPVRLIRDVQYRPSPLVPDRHPDGERPIDLGFANLRSVSPVHLEYLRNMGVGASMSASIVRNGKLWGLIACHHRTPLLVDFERRQGCALIAQLLVTQLDAQDRIERARQIARVEALRVALLHAASEGSSVDEALLRHGRELLKPLEAGGFAFVRAHRTGAVGTVPEQAVITALAEWLDRAATSEPFATDHLGAVFPPALAHTATASGLLAVPLSRSEGSYLLWFRPEQLRSVQWAGPPSTGATHLHPRASFDRWTEDARGRSTAWSSRDVATALQLREVVLDLSIREKDELERRNIQLALSTRELETFIYVASHDIKEPLRQMEMLASLLRTSVREDAEAEVAEYFGEFKTVANRLRTLTDQLAAFAKLERDDRAFVPVALDDVLEEVAAQFRRQIAAAGAQVDIGALPVVNGIRAQIHQVFVNLFDNALKYRDTDRPLRITVDAVLHGAAQDEAIGLSRPMAAISVTDNGIGFDPKYDDRVFEAFWRLHPRERYDGTGIGLAICRRIVARHRGRIEAHGNRDGGATFTLKLPLVPAAGTASPKEDDEHA